MAIGVSGMMHGYIALDRAGELLAPFRTWRNNITAAACAELTPLLDFAVPQRWSVAHLYQSILDGQPHVARIAEQPRLPVAGLRLEPPLAHLLPYPRRLLDTLPPRAHHPGGRSGGRMQPRGVDGEEGGGGRSVPEISSPRWPPPRPARPSPARARWRRRGRGRVPAPGPGGRPRTRLPLPAGW